MHGEGRGKYDCVRIGLNGRFDTIQAAVLIEKLKIFPDEIVARDAHRRALFGGARRRHHGAARRRRLDLGLGAIHHPRRAGAPRGLRRGAEGAGHPDRDPLSQAGARPERLSRTIPVAEGGLPVCERLATEVISLPMHAYLDEPVQDRIIAAVRRALGGIDARVQAWRQAPARSIRRRQTMMRSRFLIAR